MTTGDESKFEKLREVLRDPQLPRREAHHLHRAPRHTRLPRPPPRRHGLHRPGRPNPRRHGLPRTRGAGRVLPQPDQEGGATYMVCTDAAGEGINLQFCWLMVNYDIPWNPARLEQRMGRIHRYKQKHDPVASSTWSLARRARGGCSRRCSKSSKRIRKELGSDKVFDVIGRLFEGVSLKEYMEQSLTEEGREGNRAKVRRHTHARAGQGVRGAGAKALRRRRRGQVPARRSNAPWFRANNSGGCCLAMSAASSSSPPRCSVCGSTATSTAFSPSPRRGRMRSTLSG